MRFLIFILILSLFGCGNYVYKPTTVKPCYFTNKGDFEVSGNMFVMGEFHGAYAVTDKFAISATTASTGWSRDTMNNKDSAGNIISSSIRGLKSRDNEISIGYFAPMGTGTSLEIFGGLGFASRTNTNKYIDFRNSSNNFSPDVIIDNRYTRFFIQPAFGRNGKYFDFGLASRFNFITYKDTKHTDLLAETVVMMRGGYKYVKLMAQVGFTVTNYFGPYDYIPFSFGLGIYIMFNRSFYEEF